jgi:hypothetical protein
MTNKMMINNTCREIMRHEAVQNIFTTKLPIENAVLISFKQANDIISDDINEARQKILNAFVKGLDDLKNMIFLSRTNKSFYHQLSTNIIEQETYIYDTLNYINIYKDIDSLLDYVGCFESAIIWRRGLLQLKLYTKHKEIIQFLAYCNIKKKSDTFSYNASHSEMLLRYLLNVYCTADAPAMCCNIGMQQFSKLFYGSFCKEKQLLLKEIAQYIAKAILLKEQHIKLVSVHPFDQVPLKDLTIIIENNATIINQNNPDFKQYLLIKK